MKANKNILLRFFDFFENIPGKFPEIFVLCLYTVLLAIIAYFHEPWFDEAQSWLIARAAGFKEMLFYIPHYEGHPPFWWFVLAPFAKAGLPYELTLKTINISLCSIGMGLFLFKAPFKRVIKFLIPFTYCMFYQYGIISRCYCLTIIAFMLVSITYQKRNIKPFAYVGSLMLLCASHAFGIIFSGGLAIVWLWEMLPFTLKDILQKRQFKALALLLVWALFLIYIIRPYPDTFATNLTYVTNNGFTRFLLLIFIVPMNSVMGLIQFQFIKNYEISISSLIMLIICSLPFILTLIFILKGFKKLKLFFIPYLLFALFSSIVYFSAWHQGFAFLFMIFIAWQIVLEKQTFIWPLFNNYAYIKNFLKKFAYCLFIFVLIVSLANSIYNSFYDITHVYEYSKKPTAEFIKKYNLEDKVIFGQWIFYSPKGEKINEIATNLYNSNILPYFDTNIVNNLNFGDDKYPYNIHKIVDNEKYYKEWAKGPKPDIKLGQNFPLDMIWPDITKEEDDFIFISLGKKDNPDIFMRRDLAKKLGILDQMIESSKHKKVVDIRNL